MPQRNLNLRVRDMLDRKLLDVMCPIETALIVLVMAVVALRFRRFCP